MHENESTDKIQESVEKLVMLIKGEEPKGEGLVEEEGILVSVPGEGVNKEGKGVKEEEEDSIIEEV
jgi:hypothetical protein